MADTALEINSNALYIPGNTEKAVSHTSGRNVVLVCN